MISSHNWSYSENFLDVPLLASILSFFFFFFSFSVNLILSDLCLIFGKLLLCTTIEWPCFLKPQFTSVGTAFLLFLKLSNVCLQSISLHSIISWSSLHSTPLHSIAALQTYWVLNIKSISAIQRMGMPRNSVQTTDYRKQCFKCFHKQENRKFYYSTRIQRKLFLKFFSNKNWQVRGCIGSFFLFSKNRQREKMSSIHLIRFHDLKHTWACLNTYLTSFC